MRFVLAFTLALSTAACATSGTNRPVNVSAVRHEIDDTIQATSADRDVTSMGKTTADRATVFTVAKSGARAEETWVKAAGTWKMESSSPLDASVSTR